MRLAGRVRAAFRVWRQRAEGGAFDDSQILRFYQWFVRLVLTSPAFGLGTRGAPRGLLGYHPMGMGKTRMAVAVAISLMDIGRYEPLIIAKRSLHDNFQETVDQVVGLVERGKGRGDAEVAAAQAAMRKRFQYVTADAHNMAEQVARVAQGLAPRKATGRARREPPRTLAGSLNRRLVIVDEAHNLFRAIINAGDEGANARRFYSMAMDATDVRFLFLTGTPASKDPFELVPCFNMLAGREILPTDYETFNRLYVDGETVRNPGLFSNRILGYVTHVDHALPKTITGDDAPAPAPRPETEMPEDMGTTVIRVEMAPTQYRQYLSIREQEEAEAKATSSFGGPGAGVAAAKPLSLPGRDSGAGTYYMKSRAMQNVDGVAFERWAGPGGADPAPDLRSVSPKIADLVRRMDAARGPVVIYSQFAANAGARAVAAFLTAAGYARWKPSAAAGGGTMASVIGAAVGLATSLVIDAATGGGEGWKALHAPALHKGLVRRSFAAVRGGRRAAWEILGVGGPLVRLDVDWDLAATARLGAAEILADVDALLDGPTGRPRRAATVAHFDDETVYGPMMHGGAESPGLPDVPPVAERKFALFTGEVSPEERRRLVAEWNDPANLRGGRIFAVIISGAGAEGLDLWYVRDVYMLEPYWDRSREMQVKTRGIRMGSHAALPPEDRNVRSWIYIAAPNKPIARTIPAAARIETRSVDEMFLERGVEKHRLNDAFRTVLKGASLECLAFGYGDCRVCRPDGAPLFLHARGTLPPDAEADARRPDPCLPVRAAADSEVSAVDVTVPGDPTVYALEVAGDVASARAVSPKRSRSERIDAAAVAGARVFRRDPELEAYVEVYPAEPAYEKVLAAAFP